jgi:hypothetical protein
MVVPWMLLCAWEFLAGLFVLSFNRNVRFVRYSVCRSFADLAFIFEVENLMEFLAVVALEYLI